MPDKKISELNEPQYPLTGDDAGIMVRDNTDYKFSFSKLQEYIAGTIAIGNKVHFVTALPQNNFGNTGDVAVNTTSGIFYQKLNGTWAQVFTLPQNATSGSNILYNLGDPNATLGRVNDTYINTGNGKFFKKTEAGWSQVFSMLNGPPGGPGPKGEMGPSGINGKTVLNGTIDPANQTVGVDGDFYINTNTWIIFGPKRNGDWGNGKYMTQDIAELGDLNALETKSKGNAVAAINEVFSNTLAPAWTVYGTVPFGKYTNKMTVPQAKNVFNQYREAFQNVNAPTYTLPSASHMVSAKLSANQADVINANIEVGQSIDFKVDPLYNNGSAGGLVDGGSTKPLIITKKIGNAAAVEIGNTDPTYNLNNIVTAENIVFTTVFNYNGALIKTNDAGEPDNRGQFGAGSTTPYSTTITPRYKIFYGSLPSNTMLTSDLLRGVTGQSSVVNFIWENGAMPISLNTGTVHQRFFVAVRSGINRSLSVAKDVQTNGDVRSIYLAGKTTMNIKNGGNGDVSYDVYIYQQSVPYGETHTHELTL
jgi:hypothetical protein